MRLINSTFIVAIILLTTVSVMSQETEAVIVDEVIAQVNDSVILLSQVKSETKNAIDSLVQSGKSESEAKAIVDSKKGQLIANLINEELLVQKGKEMGVEKAVEARINQQFLEQMKQFNLKSLDELYAAMRQQNLDPDELRADLRKRYTEDEVWRNQVDSVTYWSIPDKEIKDYYAKNAAKFKKPATVTISEIFLSFAGADKEAVKVKAALLVKQLRAGADFEKVAVANSDRPDVEETKGKAGKYDVPELNPQFSKPLENVKVGGYSDPIEMDIGMEIIRVDERTKGSDEAQFNENLVRSAMLQERLPDARKEYLVKLIDDAYIKVRKSYEAMVMPLLKPEDKKTAALDSK